MRSELLHCYLCQRAVKLLLEKNGYRVYQCPSCGLGMTDLRQRYEEFLADHYSEGYFSGDPMRSAYANYRDDKPYIVGNMRKLLRHIQTIKPSGTILDVGCAFGYFIELAMLCGYEACGFDPSHYAVQEARKLIGATRVKEGPIHRVSYPPRSFDVITMLDVFEHLADPASDLRRLSTFLKDDGIVMIATGDTNSFMARLLKRRWTFYIPPQHLFFFHKRTLTMLLRQEGFMPVEWFRIGKWLSLRYVLHLAQTTGESHVGKWLYRITNALGFGRLPLYLPLQDNMVVIARKQRSVDTSL